MQKNTCYENHTEPEYEEVLLRDIPYIRVKLSERNLNTNADESISSTSIRQPNLKAKYIALVVVLSLLAIAMVAAIALSAYALVSSNQGMEILMKENQKLMLQLNKTKTDSETAGLINTLTTTNNANMALLNSLQSSVGSLTTRVNSPVNLYQNCIQETRSCTGTSGTGYLKDCVTPSLSVNKSVSC